MEEELDIAQMLSGSTADVAITDLSRRGFKKVRVLNQEAIKGLIVQAVDRVLARREEDIGRVEREKVLQESRHEFDDLLKRRVGEERERVQRTKHELEAREQEVTLLSRELATLQQEVASRRAAEEKACAEIAALREERDAASAARAHAEEELAATRGELERMSGELDALRKAQEEEERARQGQASVGELGGIFREFIQEMRTSATGRADDLKQSMEILADRIARGIASSRGPGGPVGCGDPTEDVLAAFINMQRRDDVENNFDKVNAKEAQAKRGVAGSLEKLRSMQKGGGTPSGS